jgi:P4 family phage/plasmid primase-like protien
MNTENGTTGVADKTTLSSNLSLNQLFKNTRTFDEYFTHVTMGDFKGKYNLSRQDFKHLYQLYNHKESNCIGEKPQHYSMLRFDFDIKYKIDEYESHINDENNRFYVLDEVKFIIREINNGIKNTIEELNNDDLTCCLFEKDIYKKNDKFMSGGFHLQYPKLFITREHMETIILKIKDKVHCETGIYFDTGVYKNPWLIYGSSKNYNLKPYLLTKIYNVFLNEMTVFETFNNYDLFDYNENKIEITPKNVDNLLPQIFSINPFGRTTQDQKVSSIIKPVVNEKKKDIKVNDNRDIEKELIECRKLLPLLSHTRVDEYKDWMELGWCLYSIGNGCDEAFELWNEKSQNNEKYDPCSSEDAWDKMKVGTYTIGTLKFWAKEDNPEEYEKLYKKKDSSEDELDLESDVDCPHTHEDIAIYIVKQIEKDCNIYYSNKKKCVYIYNDYSKLFEEKPIDTIMNFISFYMSPVINNKLDYLQNKISKKEDEKLKLDNDLDSKRIKKIDTDIKYLKNLQKPFLCLLDEIKSTPFQKCVLTQIKNRIKDSDEYIESTFNKIKHFLAIGDNKVINLKTLDVLDRTKEHCFTYTTNNIFKKDRPNKEWVYNYISEILKTVNNKFIQCFLTWFGYCMTGETCVKSFFILSGDGDNGKTAYFNVIKKILGKFGIVGNDKVFLLQKSHSVHSDEYLPIIGKRFAYIQEISKNSMFNEKLIKSITGGDGDISVRGCGGTTMEVILDCKLLCICNGDDIPDFVDKQGFTNRVMVIPFKNKFERDPKKLIEIESMKDDIFTELCYYAKEHFYDNNMIIDFSSEISEATNELKENKDSIKQFMDEKIEITLNDKDRIKKDTIYKMYLSYCRINNYDNIKVGKSEFYKALTDKYYLGVYRDREFKCIKFIKDDDFQELTFFGNGVPL